MKKIIYPIALVAFALVSCKKDYTCSCTETSISTSPSNGSTSSTSSSKTTFKDVKKSFMSNKAECFSTTSSYTYETTVFSGGVPTTETVKVTNTNDCSIEK
ncbi:MAG: hypothetical protein COA33_010270 [Fluviicola sp.]|nr:hypothetical protein [Fluviicola sp.]